MNQQEMHHYTEYPDENSIIATFKLNPDDTLNNVRSYLDSLTFLYGISKYGNRVDRGQLYWHNNQDCFSSNWRNGQHKRWCSQPINDTIQGLQTQFTNIQSDFVKNWNSRNMPAYQLEEKNFNSTQINKYIGPADMIGAHSDNQSNFGVNPTIMIWSLGVTRHLRFLRLLHNPSNMRSKKIDETFEPIVINMKANSVLIMAGTTQDHFYHEIPCEANVPVDSIRYSVTFREHSLELAEKFNKHYKILP